MRAQQTVPELVGGYRIDGELASGGMGVVYRAAHLVLSRRTAIKVLHSELLETESAVARMLQEARVLESIDDPGVVKIYDAGCLPDGRPWVAMELLDGVTLADHMFVRGRLSTRETTSVVTVLAHALMRAHSCGIIHRDVKPENIMLVAGPSGLTVKLIDWGIAQLSSKKQQRLTQPDLSPGTPCYMAPEQLQGLATDGRADTYALGVVAYQALSGQPPFDGDSSLEIALKTLHDEVPPLDLALAVPPRIEALIRGMLAKDPEYRPTLARVCSEFAAWADADEEDPYAELSLEIELECDFD